MKPAKTAKRFVVLGFDPAWRKNGFAVSIKDYYDRSIRFKVFKEFYGFQKWLPEQKKALADYTVVCGIENSYLVKKYFNIDTSFKNIYSLRDAAMKDRTGVFMKKWKQAESALVGRVEGAAMNRAISQLAYETLLTYFDKKCIYQFKPLARGRNATGGKKTHNIFAASVRTQNFKVFDYKIPSKANWSKPTKDITQDKRDAYFVGELARTNYIFDRRDAKI